MLAKETVNNYDVLPVNWFDRYTNYTSDINCNESSANVRSKINTYDRYCNYVT